MYLRLHLHLQRYFNCIFIVNYKELRIETELTIETPERCHWRHSDVFIVNFDYILHLVQVFLLLTLNI